MFFDVLLFSFELLNVVQHVSNLVKWHLLESVDPLQDYLEDALVLVGTANVPDDILTVGTVASEQVGSLGLVLDLLDHFLPENLE